MATLQFMLKPQASSLPGHIQAIYVHNILKLIAATLNKYDETDNTEIMEQVIIKFLLLLNFFFTLI